jgi:squalene-hopene/tetraprenyl-beta-curcumene cyclase
MSPSLQIAEGQIAGAAQAIRQAAEALLSAKHQQGYWWADLTADTTLESDFILYQLWMHPPAAGVWNPATSHLVEKAARSILARQLPDGGFNIYPQGPAEISASIKAYFALKLARIAVDDPRMTSCRDRILAMGGLQAANSYVKVNLGLFGLYPREHCPTIPPEMMLAGNLIYEMSSWTRAIVIPLSIIHSMNPMKPVPAGFNLQEITVPGKSFAFRNDEGFFSWRNLFIWGDRILKLWEEHGSKALRRRAIKKAERWMLERFQNSDGLATIYPSMQYSIFALDVLGYSREHPEHQEARRQFENLMVDDGERFLFQPCFSVVWDTAIAAYALGESGMVEAEHLRDTADWLLTKEVRRKGDWSVKRPDVEPSGWYFEFANEFYPDIDDTAMVLLALAHARGSRPAEQNACIERAVNWLLEMQGKDGGWAAFDVDNNWQPLSFVPFADHNAMLDPSCPDITGRVLEALIAHGVPREHASIRRGVAFLNRAQEQDGSWYGRWGVNYIYGTFLALRGLQAAGESDRETEVLRAGGWIRSIQNSDGGWGESCSSYDDNTFRAAPSTASQTAWAILGLLAGGDTTSTSLKNGIEYLIETQRRDGTWDEDLATGTGFPKVFYLTYHLYRNSFPVLALATYLNQEGYRRQG